MPIKHQAGYSLVEMLIAIAIFASLALMTRQLMMLLLKQDQQVEQRNESIEQIQVAFQLIENDLLQALPDHSWRIGGVLTAPNFCVDKWTFSTENSSRMGFLQIAKLAVSYQVEAKQLIRQTFEKGRLQKTVLLSDVNCVRLRYFQRKNWRDLLIGDQPPFAIELNVRFSNWTVERLWLLGMIHE